MTMKPRPSIKHPIHRCLFSELQFHTRLVEDFMILDIDEICNQLYADVVGRGINGKSVKFK